jgi:UDP-N-acetylmuramyl tripeptide synthase
MADNFPTLDQLRLPEVWNVKHDTTNPQETTVPFKAPKVKGEFLKGPIPLDWLGIASGLPGKATLATALAIMFEVGRRKSKEIVLTTAILGRFNVNRKGKYRALTQLEAAKLISVLRRPHKNPVVTVLAVEQEQHAMPVDRDVPKPTKQWKPERIAIL